MSLSLKAELETWAAALKAYDEQDFEKALDLFSRIADSSKILTNMGLIHATIGEHETAVEYFTAATNLDTYLAIAYFQCGVSNFLLQRYDLALLNFEDAYLYLRGNEAINYDQIGLKFKLFSAEILFNKGLTQLNLGFNEQGMGDMQEASKLKVTDEHGVIDEAIRDRGEGYTVFSIPVGVVYRPSENKLKNSKSKDYLGKAKLVAATDSNDAFTEFTGVVKRQQAEKKEVENKTEIEWSPLKRSTTTPSPHTDQTAGLERSRSTRQNRAGARPDAASALRSRRSRSVSNSTYIPPTPSFTPDLSRSNTALTRSNTTRLPGGATTNPSVPPSRVKTPVGTISGIAGIGTDGGNTIPRPSLRKTKGSETPPVPQRATTPSPPQSLIPGRYPNAIDLPPFQQQFSSQPPPSVPLAQYTSPTQTPATRSPPQSILPGQYIPPQGLTPQSPQSIRPGQYTNAPPTLTPLVLPAAPVPSQAQEGHLTQIYNSYMDGFTGYTDDTAPQSSISRPPTSQPQSSVFSTRQSAAAPQEQRQSPTWIQSAPSPGKSPSNSSSNSGMSRTLSRANAATTNSNSNTGTGMNQTMGLGMTLEPMDQNMNAVATSMGKGGIHGGTLRRKAARRPTTRRITVYEDDDGDDGFVTGEYEEFEMANIRVKLHYQSDVRGMAIPPTTTFREFVERVTSKFGTSLTGLAMKFVDEDGTKISLRDESDFELAIETARENAKGRSEGKIEVWCVDV